jgi:hypothetical protein
MQNLKSLLRPPYWFLRNWRYQLIRAQALAWNWRARSVYEQLSEADFWATRRSDTLFIFGSGASVNDIPPQEWAAMAAHDTLSFNWFIHQDFIRIDYHIIRELLQAEAFQRPLWEAEARHYATTLEANPHYQDTLLLIQGGWLALTGNRLVGLRMFRPGRRIFRFHNQRVPAGGRVLPNARLADGLVHHLGTLSDALNIAYAGGWRRAVLVGVDLYDRRVFWLPPDELRPDYQHPLKGGGVAQIDTPHQTMLNGLLPFLKDWYAYLGEQGLQVMVYNPRSLLADFMPVYQAEELTHAAHPGPDSR